MSGFGLSPSDLKSKGFFLFCNKVQQSYEDKSTEVEAGYIPQLAIYVRLNYILQVSF